MYKIETDFDVISFDENGGDKILRISTNDQWQVNTNSDWIGFTPTMSGEKAQDQAITISALLFNEDNGFRTAVISIKCGNIATDAVVRKFITITQEGPYVEDRDSGIYSTSDLIAFGNPIASTQDYSKWSDGDGTVNLMNDLDFGSTPIPCMGGQTLANDTSSAFAEIFDGQQPHDQRNARRQRESHRRVIYPIGPDRRY